MLKYEQIAKSLVKIIKNNHLKQGDKLPSLNELGIQFKASKTTLLKALSELESEGLIYQIQGSGIYVRKLPKDDYINFSKTNHGWTNELMNEQVENANASLELITPNLDLAQKLKYTTNTKIYKIHIKKMLHKKILCIETSYYNSQLVPFLNQSIIEGSIFNFLAQAYKIHVGFSDKYFYIRKLTDQETSELDLETNSFGLIVDEIFYSTSGTIFDYSQNIFNYQNSKFYL